jgi:hypothetical protein
LLPDIDRPRLSPTESHRLIKEKFMNTRRLLIFLAALLITTAQTLLVAVDTAATAQAAAPSFAAVVQLFPASSAA